mgnify:CR=1 FL=1
MKIFFTSQFCVIINKRDTLNNRTILLKLLVFFSEQNFFNKKDEGHLFP